MRSWVDDFLVAVWVTAIGAAGAGTAVAAEVLVFYIKDYFFYASATEANLTVASATGGVDYLFLS